MVKYNTEASKDALFGGGAKSSSGSKSNRDDASKKSSSSSSSRPVAAANSTEATSSSNARGYQPRRTTTDAKSKKARPALSGEAAATKLKEAADYKTKANKAMESSFFSKPDPVAASTYYKRAADCYAQAGDYKMERFCRVSSGQCNFAIQAWASAAQDYTKAAELVLEEDDGDVKDHRQEAYNYHRKASEAWVQMNERAKAAKSLVLAALALNHGQSGTLLSKESLAGMEEAIEAHVPDPLNPHVRYRQTGHSAFIDPDSDETAELPSPETLAMCREHLVSDRAYSHEPLIDLIYVLVGFGEYASALYAAGAAAAILEADGISTLTLSRIYVVETILQLAMGDPIAAEQEFLKRHVQKTAYLNSRECKLAEDLFRAIKRRDADDLEEVRTPAGSNKTALANLDLSMRTLVQQLRVSGVARKVVGDVKTTASRSDKSKDKKKSSSSSNSRSKKDSVVEETAEPSAPSLNEVLNMKTGYEGEAAQGAILDPGALNDELDALDLGSDDEDDMDSLEDEDEFDLR
ncbi:hypothetical protein MPSEU_000185800 [Mayamaea pseudoterrestris]|nr:hypothetical protein MPSEU_000185800 [Mayamaea pseudoterrestris]